MRTMLTCKMCPRQFPLKYPRGGRPQVYCSKRCRYQDMYVTKTCPTCGKEFRNNLLSTRKEYCSLACIQREPCQLCGKIITGRHTFQGGPKKFCGHKCANIVNRTLAGKKNYVLHGFVQTIRRLGKLACEKCGVDNPYALTVHHIDRSKRNNAPSNLVTLCANCHALEHWSDSKARDATILVAHYIVSHRPNA
jgi:endogenous inhibitor of DNA gyrase (YacG/DUF329 family)